MIPLRLSERAIFHLGSGLRVKPSRGKREGYGEKGRDKGRPPFRTPGRFQLGRWTACNVKYSYLHR